MSKYNGQLIEGQAIHMSRDSQAYPIAPSDEGSSQVRGSLGGGFINQGYL